jgi:hypothetical protein
MPDFCKTPRSSFAIPVLKLLLIFLFNFPDPIPAAEYNRLETEHFIFFYLTSDKVIADSLVSQAESVRDKIISDLGVVFKTKTRVYLAPTENEFQKLQPRRGKAPTWAAGTAYPALNFIILKTFRAPKGFQRNLLRNFTHELTHITIGRAFRRHKIPRWLNEGLAMYESREWQLNRLANMTRAVLTRTLIPLKDLTENFPWEYRHAALAYDQSFYLVSYLLSKKGRETFHKFIREYGRGKKFEQVLSETYGLNLVELEKEWHAHLRFRFSWLPLIFSTTTLWFVITLIFLVSYWRKKKDSRLKQTQWEEEDLIELNSLE